MKNKTRETQESTLTQSMDIGTAEYEDFKALLLKRSQERTEDQRRSIDLLALKYQMEDYLASEDAMEISAGSFLKDILKTLHIQQKKFAAYIGMKPSNLSKLISGERNINYDLALTFGRIFEHDPMLWIQIQAKNELMRLQHAEKRKYDLYSLKDLFEEGEKVH